MHMPAVDVDGSRKSAVVRHLQEMICTHVAIHVHHTNCLDTMRSQSVARRDVWLHRLDICTTFSPGPPISDAAQAERMVAVQ